MKLIPQSVTRGFGRTVLKTKKNSPHIFFAGGIVGVVGSTVLACRATLKLEKKLDELRSEVLTVKELRDSPTRRAEYDDQAYYKDMLHVYGKGVKEFGKLYGPAIILGGVSVAALTGSHVQLARRNAALTAAFTALSTSFDNYRERVRQEVGEERELELYRCMEDVEYEDDKGKIKKVKAVNPNGMSVYARCFDESNPRWEKSAELNRLFIQCQQNYLNHLLTSRGYVFLNEAYEQLGFEHTSAGQVVGWLRDGDGDKHVDLGMFEAPNARFMNGEERSIWLDFNVDGAIYEMIDRI